MSVELGEGGAEVLVDSGQIVPAIASILSNSIQSYDQKSGVINVSTSSESGFVKLVISDNGCGMDAETVGKAMQPFFSAEAAGRRKGMGLAQAQRYIQLNDGSIDIESTVAVGTTVTVLLPCK